MNPTWARPFRMGRDRFMVAKVSATSVGVSVSGAKYALLRYFHKETCQHTKPSLDINECSFIVRFSPPSGTQSPLLLHRFRSRSPRPRFRFQTRTLLLILRFLIPLRWHLQAQPLRLRCLPIQRLHHVRRQSHQQLFKKRYIPIR